ncbi:MAG: SpoIID/LytB domain-containing protein [Candidatus Marinimicrobia bacterium]|nr:SpoIID/LytB domain-containing protein [Candidatus Neomarinimicrobiota bacterium]
MTKPSNNLPKSEPVLRIGIILPVDYRKSIEISFTNPSQYKIDSKIQISLISSKLRISKNDGDVKIIKKDIEFDGHGITVHNVPAGRGFHWEKTINVTLPGDVQITNRDGYLLVINEVPLEQYLACVAVSEMSGACPPSLLEAQTITARSWILAAVEKKHADLGIDACSDDCCQRYQGLGQMTETSKHAVNNSRGQVLIYENEICDARYSKSCGGITESAENVWDMPITPYLTSVYDGPETDIKIGWDKLFTDNPKTFCSPAFVDENELHQYLGNVDKKGQYFRWHERYTQEEFCEFFSKNVQEDVTHITKIDVLNRGHSGRINHLVLYYQTSDGKFEILEIKSEYDIRKILHPSFLYSSCFVINMDDKHIEFHGAGWGHGVGLCQIGALGMALHGYITEEILAHYFKNTKLKTLY